MNLKTSFLGAAAALALTAPSAYAIPVDVDVELQLLIDTSGSIDSTEYDQQIDGYVSAFQNATIKNAITSQPIGAIAVQAIFWSGGSEQSILQSGGGTGASNDWFLIDSGTDSDNFASLLDGAARPFNGQTAPGSAINFGVPLFTNNYEGTNLVMDVSGDGVQNEGADTATASANAIIAGISRINGVAIGATIGDSLYDFYNNSVRAGTNSFVLTSSDFTTFGSAIERKLVAEITDDTPAIPLPASALLLASAAGGFGFLRLRKRR